MSRRGPYSHLFDDTPKHHPHGQRPQDEARARVQAEWEAYTQAQAEAEWEEYWGAMADDFLVFLSLAVTDHQLQRSGYPPEMIAKMRKRMRQLAKRYDPTRNRR